MKIIFHSLIVILCATALQSQARTGGGFDHDNGGDICENQFKNVRDNLMAWIIKGAAKDLRFPEGVTHEKYVRTMINKMSTAKISCTDKQLFIGSAEKTCKNFLEADGTPSIQCNKTRFMATLTPDQYILVHHEYAGLSGFEVNQGEESNYVISNQIIRTRVGTRIALINTTLDFLTKVTQLPNNSPEDNIKKSQAMCMFIGRINQGDITQELYNDLISFGGNASTENVPYNTQFINQLRINIIGLGNYCAEGFYPEDKSPITFNNTPALKSRINEIQKQLSIIENYLDQRFPKGI